MKLRCIIVEDENVSRTLLENYCQKTEGFDLLGSFPNAEEALTFLQENQIELLFLDVEMPGINGFQLLDQLTYEPYIILTTSKTEYAFTAFEYDVTDYLKKPIGYKRFREMADKVLKIHEQTTGASQQTELVAEDDIFIKSDGKLVRLSLYDILYIECLGDYLKYITGNKNYVTYATIKSVEERMNKQLFMKVHRSYIVNIKKIQDIQDNSILINGKVIPISRAHKSDLMQRLKLF
jgi:DNA-binding LytR/AlgR family response regulator